MLSLPARTKIPNLDIILSDNPSSSLEIDEVPQEDWSIQLTHDPVTGLYRADSPSLLH